MSDLTYEVINSDCLDAMRGMDDCSVDAVVTDPPYGLAFMGAKWDSFGGSTGNQTTEERQAEGKRYADENKGAPRYGNSHGHAPRRNENVAFQETMTPIFAEMLRITNPGGALLAFGSPRTFHRLFCAVEDAGWVVRDCIMYVHGSGFPKGMDVGKAIDKTLGAKRKSRDGYGEHKGNVNFGMKNRCSKCGKPYFSANPCMCPREDKEPITEQARRWVGWNTQIKPAFEPIVVAQRPLDGTVAQNVLKWGVGALNVDACRIGDDVITTVSKPGVNKFANKYSGDLIPKVGNTQHVGRFPANLVHDGSDDVLAHFNGDAARFFYCAKASRSDRGEGNDHVSVKPTSLMQWLVRLVCPRGGVVLDPFCGSGSTGVACVREEMQFIGIDAEEHYCDIARRRIQRECDKGVQRSLF